jgi:hypothetical protein
MDTEVMAALTQFGVAGMVCFMWLVERRASGERERQLTEAHSGLMKQHHEQCAVIEVVRDNTRAMASLEAGQRGLVEAIDRLGSKATVG